MSSRALFKDKQLRLCVVTTLAAGPVVSTTEALLLPPKPLAFSSTWDCRSGSGNDWLCRTQTGRGYSQSLESVARDRSSWHGTQLRLSTCGCGGFRVRLSALAYDFGFTASC